MFKLENILRKLLVVTLLFVLSSCALIFNDKKAPVKINSNPPGASIIIEGRNYGVTPAVLSIEPKPYQVSLLKEGYGSANFKMDIWQGMEPGGDGKRCFADMMGFVFVITFYSAYFSDECKTFKKEEYNIDIPYTASQFGGRQTNQRSGQMNNNNSQARGNYYPYGGYGNGQDEYYMQQQGRGRNPKMSAY